MISNNSEDGIVNYMSSKAAASVIGVSVPTLFRFAGTKRGKNGELFPSPFKGEGRALNWAVGEINHWVEVNGKQPPTRKGRPKGSTKNKSSPAYEDFIEEESFYDKNPDYEKEDLPF